MTWSSTKLSAVRRCLRLYRYRYGLGIGEPTSDAARFGSVGHVAIEHGLHRYHYGADARLAVSLGACDALADRYERARLRAAIVGYWTRWGDERWEILGVEVPFRFLLGDIELIGQIDAIIRRVADGRVYVVEHKFTSQDATPGSVYWDRLTIDTQVSIYVDGATILGHDVAGVIYDVIDRPGHRPALATPADRRKETKGKGCKACGGRAGGKGGPMRGTGKAELDDADPGDAMMIVMGNERACSECDGSGWSESPRLYEGQRDTDEDPDAFEVRVMDAIAAAPDDYYHRATIVRLDDELPKMRSDILDTIKLARLADLLEIHPRNTDACARFGTMCSFFDACAGRADITDAIRFPRRAHTELAAPNP